MVSRLWISICVCCVFCGLASASNPRDELLKRVPGDVGFVVIVNDLRGNLERIQNSPFTKRYLSTVRGKEAASGPQWQQLATVNTMLKNEVGAEWHELRDGLLGDCVVFIYRPGLPEKPDIDDSLLLIHARDPKLSNRMFEHLDAAQKKSGQLKEMSTLTYAGRNYIRRIRTDEPPEFHYTNGSLVVFGSSESLIKDVIDRDIKPQESPVAKAIDELGLNKANIVWWINPRSFDSALALKREHVSGPEAVAITALTRHWSALDCAALSWQVDRDAELKVTFTARPGVFPASTGSFLQELAKPSALLSAFPEDALVTWSGRFSVSAAIKVSGEFLPDKAQSQLQEVARRTLGATLGDEVLTALPDRIGPDWGVCVTAPPSGTKSQWPVVIAAVRLADAKDGLPVINRITDGLNVLTTLAVVGFNNKNTDAAAKLGSERQGDVDVRFVSMPPSYTEEFRPAFAWKAGYLVLSSHPDAIRRFTPPTSDAKPADTAPLLRINAPAWAKYLREHREAVAGFLAKQEGTEVEKAKQRLDSALELLDLFNGVDLSIQTIPGRASLSFKVKPAASFSEKAQ